MKIEPTYVTFEQAKLLKGKGFDVKCKLYYSSNSIRFITEVETNFNSVDIICSAPEQWQVVEWLRVKYNVHVTYDVGLIGYYGLIKHRHSNGSLYLSKWVNEQENPFNSPQEAYSAAFDYILKKLI